MWFKEVEIEVCNFLPEPQPSFEFSKDENDLCVFPKEQRSVFLSVDETETLEEPSAIKSQDLCPNFKTRSGHHVKPVEKLGCRIDN